MDDTIYCTFGQMISGVPAELRPICNALRVIVTDLDREYVEVVWKNQRIASYGVGPKKMSEHYVYIAPQTKHVNLGFYHGISANDPSGLLEGTGKRLRHIKFRSLDETKNPQIEKLIADAIAARRSVANEI